MTHTNYKTVAGATANPVVATDRYWLPIATCPIGKKVNLLTNYGIAVAPSAISEKTRHLFMGWEPLARIPAEWK